MYIYLYIYICIYIYGYMYMHKNPWAHVVRGGGPDACAPTRPATPLYIYMYIWIDVVEEIWVEEQTW